MCQEPCLSDVAIGVGAAGCERIESETGSESPGRRGHRDASLPGKPNRSTRCDTRTQSATTRTAATVSALRRRRQQCGPNQECDRMRTADRLSVNPPVIASASAYPARDRTAARAIRQ